MPRETLVWDRERGDLVPASEFYASRPVPRTASIISDSLGAPTWHPATGARTDSKSQFRRMTRDAGCVEVGNDHNRSPRAELSAPGADIARSIAELGG